MNELCITVLLVSTDLCYLGVSLSLVLLYAI